MKIKKNDTVAIIAGKDKGKKGKVIRILRKLGRVVIEKINLVKKHIKKTPERAGQRVEFEAPIDVSNVQIICGSCKKQTRIKIEKSKTGKKTRLCKKCGASLENTFVKS